MDYEVDYSVLDRAGTKAVGVAADIAGVLADMHMNDVAGAIPGSMSAGVATSVSNGWREGSESAVKTLESYGKNLTETAVAYRKIEEANSRAATSFFGGI